jgi:hypothetical protein
MTTAKVEEWGCGGGGGGQPLPKLQSVWVTDGVPQRGRPRPPPWTSGHTRRRVTGSTINVVLAGLARAYLTSRIPKFQSILTAQ